MIKHRIARAAAALAVLCLPGLGLAQSTTSSTATGISRLMNPAMSINALLLGQASRDVPTRAANQIGLQELEVQFSSVVDPFWTADLILAVHPDEDDDEAHGQGTSYALDLEKAIVEYSGMPAGFGLRLGHDYLGFGKQNPLHTHNFAFVTPPVGIEAFLGDHGLSGTGAELAWNAPLPWWAELKIYGATAAAEIFDGSSRDLVAGARLSNLWDTSTTSTLELGFSGLTGPGAQHDADEPGGRLALYGADLTWKWLASGRSGGPAVNFTNEVLLPDPEHKEGSPLGFYSHLQVRFARGWWLGLGGSVARDAGAEHTDEGTDGLRTLHQYKANLTLAPSEFSAVRLEIRYDEEPDGDFRDLGVAAQVNFTIGSHPAHTY